jgi:PAS domain S-box-containing protein
LVTPETDADNGVYLALLDAKKRWLANNSNVHDIYTVRKLPNRRTVYIINSKEEASRQRRIQSEQELDSPIGQPYMRRLTWVDEALHGIPRFDDPYTDRYGTWITAWQPLYDSTGKVEAALGVDYKGDFWVHSIAHARLGVIWIVGAVELVFGMITGGVALEIAHQKRQRKAMDALRYSEERLALHLRLMPLAAIEWDLNFRVVQWNASAERIFGYTSSEALGKSAFDLVLPKPTPNGVKALWAGLAEESKPVSATHESRTRPGDIILCEWFHTPLVDCSGAVTGFASICQDITKRRQLEEQLHHSQKLQSAGQMAAAIAHDFNNILCVMQGHAELLNLTPNLPRNASECANEILFAGKRASGLVQQLLSFSRQHPLKLSTIDLNSTILRLASLLEPLLKPRVTLSLQLGTNLPSVLADTSLFEQALMNLAINARDAMPNGGTLTIESSVVQVGRDYVSIHPDSRAGHFVRLIVRDTGMGIPPENLKRIFEPFFTTKAEGHGTGLGLAAVYGTLKQHMGWIELDSEVGRGSTFSLFIPAAVQPSHLTPLRSATTRTRIESPARKTILVVDDESPVRDLIARMLKQHGYGVLMAGSGPEAVRVWTESDGHIDLLFTDVRMPGMSGWELASTLLSKCPTLPVVFTSGHGCNSNERPPELAQHPFIRKPFTAEQITRTLDQCLIA